MDIYNKKAAYIFVIVSVMVSVFGIGGFKLANEAKSVEDYFYGGNGVDSPASEYMAKIKGSSSNLVTIGTKYVEVKTETENLAASIEAVDDTFSSMGTKTYHLTQSCQNFIDILNKQNLKDKDAEYLIKISADLKSDSRLLRNHDYNDFALKFNKTTDNFYTKAVGAIWGISVVPVFE